MTARYTTIHHRTEGIGMLSKEDAYFLGAVGPTARASDVQNDARTLGYGAYNELSFKPVVTTNGDSLDRTVVRAKELFTSADLIREAIEKMPSGEIEVKVKGNPDGEFFSQVEQPRGECIHL